MRIINSISENAVLGYNHPQIVFSHHMVATQRIYNT